MAGWKGVTKRRLFIIAHLPLWVFLAWMAWGRWGPSGPVGPEDFVAADGGGVSERPTRDELDTILAAMKKIEPLFSKLGKPGPSDWLAQHREQGQDFRDYVKCRPMTARGKRRVIYIQPVGDFDKKRRKIVRLTAEFMGIYFDRPVKIKKDLPLSTIPARARRKHPSWGDKQLLTTYILDDVLKPKLPDDAAAFIAFTASDLWPGRGWNFVFGQASLRERVGVWSIYRNGDPSAGEGQAYRLCLLRTMKTATHETGHMFSMFHCIKYECNMCGSNHREESDRRPILNCPECMAKVCWATGAKPVKRYKALEAFCREQGLKGEAALYAKCLEALGRKPASAPAAGGN